MTGRISISYLLRICLMAVPILFCSSSRAQHNTQLPGKWTGVQYISSPGKKDKAYRTVSLPEIADSTYMELTIKEVNGNYFSGTLYRSFFQKAEENFCMATVDGTISGNRITVKVLNFGKNQLKKYPGFYWCAGTLNLTWKQDEKSNDAALYGKSSDAECFSGPVTLQKKEPKPKQEKPAYAARKDSVFRTIPLINKQFTLELFDNGVVDGDSVTVYFNQKVVVAHQLLTGKPITLTLTAEEHAGNILVMYADNLGTVPPNTAVMKIRADGKVYEVFMKSDLQSNAVIRFTMSGKKE